LAILDKCEVLRLALSADDQPYIIPMNFAYQLIDDKVVIYLHCASSGTKLDILRRNNKVCFEVDCNYQVLTAPEACEWSATYESVIGFGQIGILQDEDESQKAHALDVLMAHHGFPGTPHYDPKDLARVTLLRIEVSSLTGKRRARP